MIALVFSACQKSGLNEEKGLNDGIIKYAVATCTTTKSMAVGEIDSNISGNIDGTVLTFSDKSGSLIPMEEEVSDGINNPVTSALTKGTLVNNTGDDDKTLETFAAIVGSFVTKAYDGSSTEKAVQTVTWDGSSSIWVGSPVAYWPQGESLNFFAYANLPSGQTASIASTGVSTSHTVPASADAQTDILFGHYQGDGGNTGTANIRFEHPLTAVCFLRGTMDEDFVIKSISLEGVAESGTATMNTDGVIGWSDVGTYDYSVSLVGASGLPIDEVSGLIGEPFIIIPQALTGNNVNISVILGTDDGEIALEAVITSGEWNSGYTNKYTLSYSGGVATLTASKPEVYNGSLLGGAIETDDPLGVDVTVMDIIVQDPESIIVSAD